MFILKYSFPATTNEEVMILDLAASCRERQIHTVVQFVTWMPEGAYSIIWDY